MTMVMPNGNHAFQRIGAQDVHPIGPGHEAIGAEGQGNDQNE